MSTEPPKVVGPEYLSPLLHRAVSTIKCDARRKPESLPPRISIPGNNQLLWLESDVLAWLRACSSYTPKEPKASIFKGRANRA